MHKVSGVRKQSVDAGVIWRGDSLIDGVPETLDALRSMVSLTDRLLRLRGACISGYEVHQIGSPLWFLSH